MFTLALIAGISETWAQYKNTDSKMWVAPTCTGSALTPAIGVLYPYEVAITPQNGYDATGGTFTWKVTDNVDLLAASTVTAAEFTGAAGATPNIYNITWGAASLGNTYYLVVTYTEPNSNITSPVCDPNNMKVYEIKPINTFWLDIDASTSAFAIAPEATTTIFDVCPPDISSAVVTAAASTVKYEFGKTYLYAVIHAAGYTGNFSATLTIAGLKTNQELTLPTGWTAGAVDAMGNGTYTATLASTNDGTDHNVTLEITNNQFEGLADLPVTITIDGTYTDGTTVFKDKYDGATNCIDQPDAGDYIIETIRARPAITPTNPAPFVTPAPALNN